MERTQNIERKGTFIVSIAALISGLNVYLTKIGTNFVPQLPFVSVVLTLAGLLLLLASILLGKWSLILSAKKNLLKFLWISIIGTSIPQALLAYGISLSLVSNSFLLQIEVIYSVILSYFVLNELITKQQLTLIFLSFLGVILVLTNGSLKPINFGDILFLTVPFFFQFSNVVVKGILKEIDPLIVATYIFLIGGLILSLISLLLGYSLLEFMDTNTGMFVTIYLGFNFALGSSLWYYSLKYINLSKASSIMNIYPLIATILAILFIGETLSLMKFFGILFVLLSTLKLIRFKSTSRK